MGQNDTLFWVVWEFALSKSNRQLLLLSTLSGEIGPLLLSTLVGVFVKLLNFEGSLLVQSVMDARQPFGCASKPL